MSIIKCQNQRLKHIKRMENNFVQAFPCVENCRLNLFLQQAQPLTSMTVVLNSIIITTMYQQNKQTKTVKCHKLGPINVVL